MNIESILNLIDKDIEITKAVIARMEKEGEDTVRQEGMLEGVTITRTIVASFLERLESEN